MRKVKLQIERESIAPYELEYNHVRGTKIRDQFLTLFLGNRTVYVPRYWIKGMQTEEEKGDESEEKEIKGGSGMIQEMLFETEQSLSSV